MKNIPSIPPTPQEKNPETATTPKKNIFVPAVALVFLVALASFGVLAYNLRQKNPSVLLTGQSQNNQPKQIVTKDGSKTQPLSSDTCKNLGPLVKGKSGDIEWVNPEKLNIKIFVQKLNSDPVYANYYMSDTTSLVGHFVKGKYKDGDLLKTVLNVNEMDGKHIFFMAKKGESYTILSEDFDFSLYSDSVESLVNFSYDRNFKISDLDFPQKIYSEAPKASFTKVPQMIPDEIFCADNFTKVFTDPELGDVYTDNSIYQLGDLKNKFTTGGFFVKAPDSTYIAYLLDIPFYGQDRVPQVTFSEGKKNIYEYKNQIAGGCGAANYADIVNLKLSDLKVSGKTFDGQNIYEYTDPNTKDIRIKYESLPELGTEKKPSYESFLKDHPVFFWQNPFGQIVRFTSVKSESMAECAKPVIYLYPETTQKVSVSLEPKGGFSYTEPVYNNAWNVVAKPNGSLTNIADGKEYPYLFWEGRGSLYQMPEKGFVVKQSEISSFLKEKLKQLGLNEKESADFREFWEPKMQNSPYYFVTFMGNPVMDYLAPLKVSPKPETVIRILMDFKPLQQTFVVEGFSIKTPERKGFTVVEWGGVKR